MFSAYTGDTHLPLSRCSSLLESRHFPQIVSTGEYCCSERLLSILSVIAQSSKHWSRGTKNVALSWDHKSESPTCHPSLGQTVVSCIYSGCLPARTTFPGLCDCLPGCLSPCGIRTCLSLVRVITCSVCSCVKEGLGLSCHTELLHLLPREIHLQGSQGVIVPLVKLAVTILSHMQGVG